jgi:hypothetical protein
MGLKRQNLTTTASKTACFLDGLLLTQSTSRRARYIALPQMSTSNTQIIWREIEKVLVEKELDMSLSLYVKGHLVLTALCHKTDAPPSRIYTCCCGL